MLSSTLETGERPLRYCLTEKACKGVLRRAAENGRTLPEPLGTVLRSIASGKARPGQPVPVDRRVACGEGGPPAVCVADSTAKAAIDEELCGTLKSGGDPPWVVCGGDEPVGTLTARDFKGVSNQYVEEGKVVCTPADGGLDGYIARRITPTEAERLQGFPDGHTDLSGCDSDAVCSSVCGSLGIEAADKAAAVRRNVARWSVECPDGPRYKAVGNSMPVPVMLWLGQRIEAVEEEVRLLGADDGDSVAGSLPPRGA